MKVFVIAIATAAILSGGANAQTSQGGAQPQATEKPKMTSPATTGAAPNAPVQPGQAAPNGALGGKESKVPNPDRVPPTSPGGQGEKN
jgi:hypothetical protein